jgi:hypothetical protein
MTKQSIRGLTSLHMLLYFLVMPLFDACTFKLTLSDQTQATLHLTVRLPGLVQGFLVSPPLLGARKNFFTGAQPRFRQP